MIFKELSIYLKKLEKTPSRIEITKILSELFKKADVNEVDKIIYLVLGSLGPSFKTEVFNLSEKLVLQSVSKAYNKSLIQVQRLYKKSGDIGDASFSLAKTKKQTEKNKSVNEVFEELLKIARYEGHGSVEKKIEALAKLMSSLDALSAKYISRVPVGKLRLGFSDKTIIDALSWMLSGDKSQSTKIEKYYFVRPDVGVLAKIIKSDGIKGLKRIKPQVGVPVLPMLAQRLKSPADMIAKMHQVAVEPKLDGLRILVHFKKNKGRTLVKTFTRNLKETSWMFPELEKLGKHLTAKEAILDSEAVGLDEKTKKMANFQTTMTRRRKHNIDKTSKKIGITFYFFDCLFTDGKNLMNDSYETRRKVLKRIVLEGGVFKIVKNTITENPDEIANLNKYWRDKGLEGIMVKSLKSKYVPGRTGWRWVKMKEAESAHAKLADTIDAVVMGYTQGKGKRAGFGVGQFLVGITSGEKIKTVSKIGTGITDEQFEELKERLTKIETKNKPAKYDVHKDLKPDFWVEPALVVEVAADEITKSPRHTSGLALRFPRLIRFRDDKSINQATTLPELKNLFKLQN